MRPFEAIVDGRRYTLRVNDFPAEAFYTLFVDGRGFLRAKGNFNEAVGPSWWGVRNRKPSP